MCISRCFIQLSEDLVSRSSGTVPQKSFGTARQFPRRRSNLEQLHLTLRVRAITWTFGEFGSIDAKHMSISDRVKIYLRFSPTNNLKLGGIMQDQIRIS